MGNFHYGRDGTPGEGPRPTSPENRPLVGRVPAPGAGWQGYNETAPDPFSAHCAHEPGWGRLVNTCQFNK